MWMYQALAHLLPMRNQSTEYAETSISPWRCDIFRLRRNTTMASTDQRRYASLSHIPCELDLEPSEGMVSWLSTGFSRITSQTLVTLVIDCTSTLSLPAHDTRQSNVSLNAESGENRCRRIAWHVEKNEPWRSNLFLDRDIELQIVPESLHWCTWISKAFVLRAARNMASERHPSRFDEQFGAFRPRD